MEDPIVIETMLESGEPYLSGEKEIDDTVAEMIQKLQLYQMEDASHISYHR